MNRVEEEGDLVEPTYVDDFIELTSPGGDTVFVDRRSIAVMSSTGEGTALHGRNGITYVLESAVQIRAKCNQKAKDVMQYHRNWSRWRKAKDVSEGNFD